MNSTNMENITLKKFVDRAAREAIQRSCAAKREKQAWKSLSKKEREAAIRASAFTSAICHKRRGA